MEWNTCKQNLNSIKVNNKGAVGATTRFFACLLFDFLENIFERKWSNFGVCLLVQTQLKWREKREKTTTWTGRDKNSRWAKAREQKTGGENQNEQKNMVQKLDENQTMDKNNKLNTRRTTFFSFILFHHLWLLS